MLLNTEAYTTVLPLYPEVGNGRWKS